MVDEFTRALLDVDRLTAKQIVQNRGHDTSPIKFAEDVVLPALERIGAGWQAGTFALSQVYMAGRICEDLIDQIGCDVKLIVGGPPFRFDDRLWKTVGADAMCRDASDAVSVIEKIMEGMA